MNPQHIVSLNVSNVKRLHAVKINLDTAGGVVVLSGENSAGKSSVLDAIEMALCGKASIPGKPIRNGQESASIVLETEDLIVTRTFTAADSYIKVEGKDGRKYSKPQELLETLISRVGFNPLRFSTLPPKDQAAELLRICPTPIDLDANARRMKAAEEARRDIGRDLKRAQGSFESMPPPAVDTPEAEVSIADATAALTKATRLREEHRQRVARVSQLRSHASQIDEEITALKKKAEAYAAELSSLIDETCGAPDHDARIATWQERVGTAEQINAKVRQHRLWLAARAEVEKFQTLHEAAEGEVVKARAEREKALAEAKFPVEGLTIDPEGVITYKGAPFSQAGSADKIIVGVGLAMADNPTFRVISIPDGDKVYAKGREQLDRLAAEHDLQIWMEREVGGPAAIVIVDGSNEGGMAAVGGA